jgi:hypothetical protein
MQGPVSPSLTKSDAYRKYEAQSRDRWHTSLNRPYVAFHTIQCVPDPVERIAPPVK